MILNLKLPNVSPNLPKEHEEPDIDFVYDLESPWGSPVPCRHTRSMGTPPPQPLLSGASGSSTEPAESSDEPDDTPHTPPKPKRQPRRPKKPKQIAVKEKTYRICHGSRHTQKRCSLCNAQLPSQKDLNHHVSSVHSFQFLCKSRVCGKKFTSQAALHKHKLTHQAPHFFCIKCGNGFLFKYQLKNHTNTHMDFVIKCHYPRCGKVYQSEGEYRRHKKKSIRQLIRSMHVPRVAKTLWKKK